LNSLHNKVDSVISLCRFKSLDVVCLVETWHDSGSVCVSHLRARSYLVVERSRPRFDEVTLSTNHDSIIVAATYGIKLTSASVAARPFKFEFTCVRVSNGVYTCIILVIYRQGFVVACDAFLRVLADILYCTVVRSEPLFCVGDLNVRLDRPYDLQGLRPIDILSCRDLQIQTNRFAVML
jgi:exonuclease III